MVPMYLFSSFYVHCLGESAKVLMLTCFIFLICVLSRAPGAVKLSSNGIWSEKPLKGEYLQLCKCVQFVHCVFLRITYISGKLGHSCSV